MNPHHTVSPSFRIYLLLHVHSLNHTSEPAESQKYCLFHAVLIVIGDVETLVWHAWIVNSLLLRGSWLQK